MKAYPWLFLSTAAILTTSCQHNQNEILSQQFVHKYGFDVSKNEWQEREEEGKVITTLANGVTIVRSFEQGQLHGPTTHTFPHSSVIEKLLSYDQGVLLKEVLHDESGVPICEEIYELDDRKVVTYWDEHGVPLSVEEYEGDRLVTAEYFTPEHDLEARIESGLGVRIKRDRNGNLLFRDQVENGIVMQRTNYHHNGQIHTVSHYHDYQLHGEQLKLSSTGKPLTKANWDHGILNGTKTIYRNGLKIAEIPYINGQKHGLETHYDDLGRLTGEIVWKNDKKHGCSKFHGEEATDLEWFYLGQSVTKEKFDALEMRRQMIAEVSGERISKHR